MINCDWKNILTPDEWRDLKLSVGTHRSKRRLNPIEVAKLIERLLNKDILYEKISEEILLSVDMIKRFENLLELPEKYHSYISFGRKNNCIPFSTAAYIADLESETERNQLFNEIFSRKLTKNEVQQIIELKNRSNMNILNCVKEIIKDRPIIEERNMFIGRIYEEDIKSFIKDPNWNKINKIFLPFLKNLFPNVLFYSGNVSKDRFIIVTDVFGQKQIQLKSDKKGESFEEFIRNNFVKWLSDNYA